MPGMPGMPASQVRVVPKTTITRADDHKFIKDDIVSVQPVAVEFKWDMTDEEFNEYDKSASLLLKDNKEYREESLRRFLRRNNILVYSLENVASLLKYKNKKPNPLAYFLIKSDRNKDLCSHVSPSQFAGILIKELIFTGFMPLRSIKRILLVLEEFPELYCFVSGGYDNSCPETFVLITFGTGGEVFVIDMWNREESCLARRGE